MAKIVWLASYPKSGNTWMRILLANYLQNGDAPVNINKLQSAPIASARMWFDEWVGLQASTLDDETVDRLRPEVYKLMARSEEKTLFMKAHDAWRRTGGDDLFPASITACAVYIVRNPLDMAASCANHWNVAVSRAVERLCDSGHELKGLSGNLSDQLPQWLGSWSDHVRSWLDDSGLPVHLVRYEDLHARPEETFSEVVKACGLEWNMDRVRKAVQFSSFGVSQQQERRNGFHEKPMNAASGFFRSGKVGMWQKELTPELADCIRRTHSATMRRLGYLRETNPSVQGRLMQGQINGNHYHPLA